MSSRIAPRNDALRLARVRIVVALALSAGVLPAAARADSEYLYGIHWWGYTQGQPVDDNPAVMLDCPTYGGWTLETVLTHDASWWGPAYFTPYYANLNNVRNMTIITRIDYKWGETVPAPTSPDYAGWPASVVSAVNTLKDHCHIWIIGNEPNVTIEGNNWPSNHIDPAGYATIYRNARNAVHNAAQASPLGEHIVLTAAPSPGGAAGVRWMDGNQWLGQVFDNVPNNEIDGVALHAYGGSVGNFHSSYVSQLGLVDSKGLQDRPVYITEWNKHSTEADMAQFVRDCFADLNTWNQTPGSHNVRCLCWFVYDANNQAGGGWNNLAIEYYRDNGIPLGDASNLYTAFQQTVDLRYAAGIVGTRAPAPAIQVLPSSFTHQVYQSQSPLNDSFTVRNVGTETLNYTITDDVGWLSTDPTNGTSTGEAGSITVSYSAGALPVGGPYPATISVSDPAAINSPQTISVSVTVLAWPYPADLDRDTDVDASDFGIFQGCITGPNGGPPAGGCEDADLDHDTDIDQVDFGLLQRCLSGPGFDADPNCIG